MRGSGAISMAGSRFEYVKNFEQHDTLLLGCWAVIRLDGRTFTKFAKTHNFEKPNDRRALELSNAAAKQVLQTFDDHLAFAFGQSDEFSFVLKRESALFSRRVAKILSTIVSLYSSAYVHLWPEIMNRDLQTVPSFDARVVLYPTTKHLRDYLRWRQADVHVNNLFNTTFWALVQRGGSSTQQAERELKTTLAKDKHEILFTRFGINYNSEPPMFRKGSFLMKRVARPGDAGDAGDADGVVIVHDDIIGDDFWNEHEHLLAPSDLDPPRIRKT